MADKITVARPYARAAFDAARREQRLAQWSESLRVGAAVVSDPEHSGTGILTERDILDAVGAGQNPDTEVVSDHRTDNLVVASPDWTLEQAAQAMVRGGFRHLLVVEGNEVTGLLSMRDIVRAWTNAAAKV